MNLQAETYGELTQPEKLDKIVWYVVTDFIIRHHEYVMLDWHDDACVFWDRDARQLVVMDVFVYEVGQRMPQNDVKRNEAMMRFESVIEELPIKEIKEYVEGHEGDLDSMIMRYDTIAVRKRKSDMAMLRHSKDVL